MIRELSGGDTRGSDSPVLNSVQFLLTGENKTLLLLSLSNTHTSPCTSFPHPLCSSLGPELVSQPQRNQFFVFFCFIFSSRPPILFPFFFPAPSFPATYTDLRGQRDAAVVAPSRIHFATFPPPSSARVTFRQVRKFFKRHFVSGFT